ncbi:MAG: hypothetical protein AAF639_34820 [Chloroflexota bacterium]
MKSFDRIALLAAVILVLIIGVVVWLSPEETDPTAEQTPSPVSETFIPLGPQAGDRPLRILYSALDEQFREQLYTVELNLSDFPSVTLSEPQQLTEAEQGVWDFSISPDSNQAVYSALNNDRSSDLWVLPRPNDVDTSSNDTSIQEQQYLLACPEASCNSAKWSPDGRLVALTRRSAANASNTGGLSPPRLWLLDTVTGETAQVFVDTQTLGFSAQWSASSQWMSYLQPDDDGVNLYNLEDGRTHFVETLTGETGAWHPTNDQLIVSRLEQDEDQFWSYLITINPTSPDEEFVQTLGTTTDDEKRNLEDNSPAWSPNGSQIAFRRREREGERASQAKQLWLMNAETGATAPLTNAPEFDHGQPQWSPDGHYLLYHRFPLRGPDIVLSVWILNVETGEQVEVISPGQRPLWWP